MCLGIRNNGKRRPPSPRENKFVHMEMICIEQASVVFVKEEKGGHHYICHNFYIFSSVNYSHRRREENARIAILE